MRQRHLVRFVLVMTLVGALAGRAEAQEYGVKGGVQFTDVAWSDDFVINTPWALGAVGGLFVRFQPAKAIPLQVEALVTQLVIDFSFDGVEAKNTLTNLHVPVLVRYSLGSGSQRRLTVHGGGAVDFVLLARETVGGTTENIRDTVSPWSASLVAGGEFQWGRWVFDGRYIFGLSNLFKSFEEEPGFPSFAAKQRAIQATAGWRF